MKGSGWGVQISKKGRQRAIFKRPQGNKPGLRGLPCLSPTSLPFASEALRAHDPHVLALQEVPQLRDRRGAWRMARGAWRVGEFDVIRRVQLLKRRSRQVREVIETLETMKIGEHPYIDIIDFYIYVPPKEVQNYFWHHPSKGNSFSDPLKAVFTMVKGLGGLLFYNTLASKPRCFCQPGALC